MGTFPNKETQFSSTNQPDPANMGRPKGSKNLSTLIRELEDESFDWEFVPTKQKDLAKKIGVPWKAVVYVALGKALDGDVKAMEWLRKSGYGDKVKHEFENGFFSQDKMTVTVVSPNENKSEAAPSD